jgi:predicted enzyme related to lactoylglutathione lyase
MLHISNIMIGTLKPKDLAEFYEEVFEKAPDWSDGGWSGWQMGSFNFSIGEHSEAKGKAKEPQRMILNIETEKVKEEFERIKKIKGAEVVKEPYEMGGGSIATFADPDGNYFQLVTPWDDSNNKN